MGKKSKRQIEKMVEAKTRGKKAVKGVATDDANPKAAELDARISKSTKYKIEF